MSKLKEKLESGEFVVTVGLYPPRGADTGEFLAILSKLAGKVDAINLPDSRGASIRLSALSASILAKEKGLEPVMTVSCRDRNRIAISADLLGAHALGIDTVLCVSGDYVSLGDVPQAKPVYDLDSVQLINMIRQMEAGQDIGGNELKGSPKFFVGCVANPIADPIEPHLLKLQKKLTAGVDFIQTLDLYSVEGTAEFLNFLEDKGVKALAGLRLVTMADIEQNEKGRVVGNEIPSEVISEIKSASTDVEALARAQEFLVAMIKDIRAENRWSGIHLTMNGHEELIPQILEQAGLGK